MRTLMDGASGSVEADENMGESLRRMTGSADYTIRGLIEWLHGRAGIRPPRTPFSTGVCSIYRAPLSLPPHRSPQSRDIDRTNAS
ncbi:MAG: hypothetical protein JWP29_1648, partial [Rhodoferax sp.]|nr:hypothetical protein [Rhodoferax sp.]